jgi:hypothetical protein
MPVNSPSFFTHRTRSFLVVRVDGADAEHRRADRAFGRNVSAQLLRRLDHRRLLWRRALQSDQELAAELSGISDKPG